MRPGREGLLVAVLTAAALLPFADKAFHIDDPLFLKAAEQIQSKPLDFYGFNVNWYGIEQPMSMVTKNPPLASYFLAVAAAVAGWSEIALHTAFLLPAVAAALGTWTLARRLTARPAVAALAAVATPAFLVSSTNLMCDTMLVAFWVWAVERWMRGIETRRAGTLILAGALMAAAALTKYFGIALLPLLLVYGLARTRRPGVWALALLIPVAALVLYQVWTKDAYGRGLLADAAAYARSVRPHGGSPPHWKFFVGLSFTGGCLASAAFLAPWLWSGPALAVGGLLCVAATALLSTIQATRHWPPELTVQLVVFATAGAAVLALGLLDLVRFRDANALLLFLWIAGTFVFAVFFNWSTNVRSLLPAAPVVGLLVARRVEARAPAARLILAPLALAALLALGVARADAAHAGTARVAASRIVADGGSGTLWFEGHWGFQRYMERAGARPLDVRSHVRPGDRIAVPANNTNLLSLPRDAVTARNEILLPITGLLGTMSSELGAGFYVDSWGPLPFAFGRVPPERYVLLEAVRDIGPGQIGR
ncbi:MAG TPA: glycosyltransferase family 39 protein [Thermoanaerobaculia bacterium]|nr:glycosyltransferase family 39 protein [Thermoanaerobaculia bacterium]